MRVTPRDVGARFRARGRDEAVEPVAVSGDGRQVLVDTRPDSSWVTDADDDRYVMLPASDLIERATVEQVVKGGAAWTK